MFEVRNWSATNNQPWDVVFMHNGESHYQPGVMFSTKEKAEQHKATLEQVAMDNPESINFVLDHWLKD